MNFVFRVDSSDVIGHGHFRRCLNLADRLLQLGHAVCFISRNLNGHLSWLAEQAGAEVHLLAETGEESWQLDLELTLDVLRQKSLPVDWLVVDHYQLPADWEAGLRQVVHRVMAIDDLARPHLSDALLDQNLVADFATRYSNLTRSTTQLLGPRYALLDDRYSKYRTRVKKRSGLIRKALLAFGGTDSFNLVKLVLTGMAASHQPLFVSVVGVFDRLQRTQLASAAGPLIELEFYENLPSLVDLMLEADYAFGGAGVTTWERFCLGLPAAIFALAENQESIAEHVSAIGLAEYFGRVEDINESECQERIRKLMLEPLDDSLSSELMALCDGLGVDRVSEYLTLDKDSILVPRAAEAKDEQRLLEWANDPETRQNGFNPEAITPTAHHRWFQGKLSDAAVHLYIVESVLGLPIGQVRFEPLSGRSAHEVHYAVAPEFRGRGLGCVLLSAAIQAAKTQQIETVLGAVKASNVASQQIFKKLGFKEVLLESGHFEYIKRL